MDSDRDQSSRGDTDWNVFETRAPLRQPPHTLVLPPDSLRPEIVAVYACDRYIPLLDGVETNAETWSRLLRLAKHPPAESRQRQRILALVCIPFCDLLTQSALLGRLDSVVAIPANSARYALRGMSLPHELGRAVEASFGLPFLPNALHSQAGPELQLRGMELEKRAEAVKGSMTRGEDEIVGRSLLLVDDVVCSGATLREAAQLLLDGGAAAIYAACLASCLIIERRRQRKTSAPFATS